MALDSRQRILRHLKRVGEASVADLSGGLGLTPVTIRHHLEALQGDGLVERPTARRKAGPGRPELIYQATPAADRLMPRNYGELCSCLLSASTSARSGEELEHVLERLGDKLGTDERPAGGLGGVRRALEQRGYFPTVRRTDGGITVRLANCPYLEVAELTPALCHFDRALIEGLLGTEVRMEKRIVQNEPVCVFRTTGVI